MRSEKIKIEKGQININAQFIEFLTTSYYPTA